MQVMDRNNRVFVVAWILFWVLMIAVQLQDYVHDGGTRYWQPVLWESSSALVVTVMLLIQRRLLRRYEHLLAKPRRWFALQMACLPIYWLIFTSAVYAIRHGVYALVGDQYQHMPWSQVFVYESVRLSLYYSIFVALLFGIRSYQSLLKEKERAELSNRMLREMQLHRLAQQIQPHFLFNTLNTISQLMHVDVARADATLIQLADVLRAALVFSEQHETTLANEVHMTQAYARLMCERFIGRVEIKWSIDAATEQCKVPVMSLQPLLENIFKHTVEQRRQKTNVQVLSQITNGALMVVLEDDLGALVNGESKGIGVKNLRERLQALYGDQGSLTLSQLTPAGVRAEMRLPCAS